MNREELREAVLAIAREKRDIVIRSVATPEWPGLDGKIHVRSMSLAGRDAYIDSVRTIRQVAGDMPDIKIILAGASAKLAASTMCDERGELLFIEEDIPLLADLSALAMERVVDMASEINELDEKSAREKVQRAKNALAPAVAEAG